MADRPIIIKRIKKGGHGNHGGAWKVAYADFVTAMMAFFLLLWLLNAVTEDQLQGISNYFAPAAASKTTSGAGDILGGASIAIEGAMPTVTGQQSIAMDLPPPKAGQGPSDANKDSDTSPSAAEIDAQLAAEVLKRQEEQQFEQAKQDILGALKDLPQSEQLINSLRIDSPPEGLRIQIVDQDGLAMFPRGSSQMFDHTRNAIRQVAQVIAKMPQDVQITGHTDATPFAGSRGYSNWELSADRANATRRALIESGVTPERLARVVGAAEREPLTPENPAAPNNRRIAVTLLRGTGQDATPPANPSASPAQTTTPAPATTPRTAPPPAPETRAQRPLIESVGKPPPPPLVIGPASNQLFEAPAPGR